MSKPVYDSMSAEEFIRKYGEPYDPATDDYDRSPFIADIKEGKNDPIYNAHSYHTKVPPRAIIPYILHYTEPGDIVLDPFCGSGMTGVSAMLCEDPPKDILEMVQGMNPGREIKPGARRAILNDLSPAACHIAYNYCTPVDVDDLKKEFERIKAAVRAEFDWLYGTEHYEPAVDLYDPQKPEVAARLKNLPPRKAKDEHPKELFKGTPPERTWELISREEVKRRMGPEVLANSPLPEGVKNFVCIPAVIQYTVWSDVYRCEGMVNVQATGSESRRKAARGCGRDIVLWDCAVDYANGNVAQVFACPHCGQQWKKTQILRAACIPVLTNLAYSGFALTKKGVQYKNLRAERKVSQVERALLSQAENQALTRWTPKDPIDKTRDMYVLSALHLRNIETPSDFFTPRTLQAISAFHSHTTSASRSMQAVLRFIFTSAIPNMAKTTRFRFHKAGNGAVTGTLYIGSFPVENNFLEILQRKFDDCLRTFEATAVVASAACTSVLNGPAQKVPISDCSVDYVFADPPFGSNIFYGDCSLLWESWLGTLTDRSQEAVISRNTRTNRFKKTLDDYATIMSECFCEMHRVLKPGRWATIEFSNSDGRVFEAIKKAARDAGFEIVNMLFLDKDQKSFKQVKGAKGEEDVMGHDALFNLRKPGPVERPKIRAVVNGQFEHLVVDTIHEHLRGLPEQIKKDAGTYSDEHRTTPFLNTMLMNALIPKGVNVERLNLPFIDALCSRYFRKIDNRWYLPDEAVGNGQGGMTLHPVDVEIADEVSAIEWLRQLLTREPMMLGDIKPLWMRATVRLTGVLSTHLERILSQNFWLDRTTNKWREPTDEERNRMDTTDRDRVLHNAERFLAGTLKDSPSDAELCQWIGVLYDAAKAIEEEHAAFSGGSMEQTPVEALDIYSQINSLFNRVLAEKVDSKVYATTARQVRMASIRLQHAEEAKPKPAKAKTLFDT